MSRITLEYVYENDKLDEIKKLFIEYVQSLGVDLSFQGFQEELQSLPGKYAPPDGILLLAEVEGKAAGCVALRKIDQDICEMKRLYVRPAYRGLGIGKSLVERIIREGSRLGYGFMRLDTLPSMGNAQSLYQGFGFYDIEPYIFNPVEGTRYMELKLNNAGQIGDGS